MDITTRLLPTPLAPLLRVFSAIALLRCSCLWTSTRRHKAKESHRVAWTLPRGVVPSSLELHAESGHDHIFDVVDYFQQIALAHIFSSNCSINTASKACCYLLSGEIWFIGLVRYPTLILYQYSITLGCLSEQRVIQSISFWRYFFVFFGRCVRPAFSIQVTLFPDTGLSSTAGPNW